MWLANVHKKGECKTFQVLRKNIISFHIFSFSIPSHFGNVIPYSTFCLFEFLYLFKPSVKHLFYVNNYYEQGRQMKDNNGFMGVV